MVQGQNSGSMKALPGRGGRCRGLRQLCEFALGVINPLPEKLRKSDGAWARFQVDFDVAAR